MIINQSEKNSIIGKPTQTLLEKDNPLLSSERLTFTREEQGVITQRFVPGTNKHSIGNSDFSFENSAFEDHRDSKRWQRAESAKKVRGISLLSSRGRKLVEELEPDEDWFEVQGVPLNSDNPQVASISDISGVWGRLNQPAAPAISKNSMTSGSRTINTVNFTGNNTLVSSLLSPP